MNYETTIGLEVHAQLSTASKMFCSCDTSFSEEPNINICPVCTAQPGALPSVNKKAIEYAYKVALALNCKINRNLSFDRKNYFYPDLPKGYQISQNFSAVGENGYILIDSKVGIKKIRINRVHIEEDAGKNIHNKETLLDLNRAGIPLVEIVSEPDLSSPEEAFSYFKKLKTILSYLDVCHCNMEDGNLRCDANLSLKKHGSIEMGTKVEIKNLNSFRFMERALCFEVERQKELLDKGEKIIQETRLFNTSTCKTKLVRKKEDSLDYRYFREPDILNFNISDEFYYNIKSTIPELPDEKKDRFIKEYKLSFYDASVLTSDRNISLYFEKLYSKVKDAKLCSNWIQTEVMRVLNDNKIDILRFSLSYIALSELLNFIKEGIITQKVAKSVFADMVALEKDAKTIIEEKGLLKIQDEDLIIEEVKKVLSAFPDQIKQYKNGKTNLMGFFVGQVMKNTQGRANPELVNSIIKKELE